MLRSIKLRSIKKLAQWPVAGFLLAAGLMQAAILPDQIGDFKKESPKTVAAPDPELDQEYGFDTGEQAEYKASGKHFTATAWRMRDSTGGMAFFEAIRPAKATSSELAKLAVKTPDGVLLAYGNYVFRFAGDAPDANALQMVFAQRPKLEQSPLPPLMTFLPPANLVPNSERYIVGPISLQRFAPKISPSTAAFHLGAEAQLGVYETPKGPLTLIIFEYPTPNIARDRYAEFQKIPGTIPKRIGALVASVVSSPDPDAAERVLAQVKYETNITWNEKVPVNEAKGVYKLLLDIFIFSGVMVGLCVIAGIGFAAVRIMGRRMGGREEDAAMITLRIGNNKP
jgi:hypothetical protein